MSGNQDPSRLDDPNVDREIAAGTLDEVMGGERAGRYFESVRIGRAANYRLSVSTYGGNAARLKAHAFRSPFGK